MYCVHCTTSLLLINIIIYVVLTINLFLIFFLHDTRFFRTLNELKNLNVNTHMLACMILCFLSMAGMPPLLGFFGKFLTTIFFFSKQHYLLLLLFIFLNIFVIYFYILNLRFLLTKTSKPFFFLKNYTIYYNFNFICLLFFFTLLNFFGIFYINDLILFILYFSSFNF